MKVSNRIYDYLVANRSSIPRDLVSLAKLVCERGWPNTTTEIQKTLEQIDNERDRNYRINKAMIAAKAHFGHRWKTKLSACWGSGLYPSNLDSESLQEARNSFGPDWLTKYRLPTDGDSLHVLKGV